MREEGAMTEGAPINEFTATTRPDGFKFVEILRRVDIRQMVTVGNFLIFDKEADATTLGEAFCAEFDRDLAARAHRQKPAA